MPVQEGYYQPDITWTDFYPFAIITLTLPAGDLTFLSASQGETRVPWGVLMAGKQYVSYSTDIEAALQLLTAGRACKVD